MTVTVEQLGPFLTAAGRTALSNVEATLRRRPGAWTILTNVCLDAPTDDYLERLHLVIVGPPGVTVCEVRRGDRGFVLDTTEFLQVAALRAHQKAERLSTSLTQAGIRSVVRPVLALHTHDIAGAPSATLGVPIVQSAGLGTHASRGVARLSPEHVATVVTAIRAEHVRHDQAVNLGIARGLVVEDATGAPFHVTYRARLANDQPILVHLHDLTAGKREDAYRVAERGYDVLADLAPNPNIPPIVERLALHPANDGDLVWFAVGDDKYRSLTEASTDPDWNIVYRVRFAAQALSVLAALHRPTEVDIEGLVLRDINPSTLCVALDNQPYFSRFRLARYVGRDTIALIAGPQWQPDEFTAPEVRDGGLDAASAASDVFSLCACLIKAIEVPRAPDAPESGLAPLARAILNEGCAHDSGERPSPIVLARSLDSLFDDESQSKDDDRLFPGDTNFGYEIVRQLGNGGFGSTFLVREEQDEDDPFLPAEDESDCLVAKLPHDPERATRTIRGHRLARPYSDRDASLATVLHVAGNEWEPGKPAALITYVKGTTLRSASASLRADRRADAYLVETCTRWYTQTLRSLTYLHPRLVHGDVSPDNILLSGTGNVLVDYDTVTPPGNIYRGERVEYASHQRRQGARASCAEDVFACAATIFDCLIGGGNPFMRLGRDNPRDGLAWPSNLPYEEMPAFKALKACLDQATAQDPADRYRDATQALEDFQRRMGGEPPPTDGLAPSVPSRRGPPRASGRSGKRASDPASATPSIPPTPIGQRPPRSPRGPEVLQMVYISPQEDLRNFDIVLSPSDYLRYFDLVSEFLSGQDAGDDGR